MTKLPVEKTPCEGEVRAAAPRNALVAVAHEALEILRHHGCADCAKRAACVRSPPSRDHCAREKATQRASEQSSEQASKQAQQQRNCQCRLSRTLAQRAQAPEPARPARSQPSSNKSPTERTTASVERAVKSQCRLCAALLRGSSIPSLQRRSSARKALGWPSNCPMWVLLLCCA